MNCLRPLTPAGGGGRDGAWLSLSDLDSAGDSRWGWGSDSVGDCNGSWSRLGLSHLDSSGHWSRSWQGDGVCNCDWCWGGLSLSDLDRGGNWSGSWLGFSHLDGGSDSRWGWCSNSVSYWCWCWESGSDVDGRGSTGELAPFGLWLGAWDGSGRGSRDDCGDGEGLHVERLIDGVIG